MQYEFISDFIYELTVYRPYGDAALDEGGVYIEHNGDGHLARAHLYLGHLKRNGAIGVPTKDPFAVWVLVLLECKVLAALQPLVCKQLTQNAFNISFVESDILYEG